MDTDIAIRGGTLVDGTGSPGRLADVAVRDGKIVEIGTKLHGERRARRLRADRRSRVHRHPHPLRRSGVLGPVAHALLPSRSDYGRGRELRILHCADFTPRDVGLLARTLQHVEDMSFDTLAAGVPWEEFETFPQYLDSVASHGVSLNFACYVGHTAVRIYVMGDDAYERPATDDELRRMQEVVAESMAAGAAGFSTSASPTHNGDGGRPVPSRVADLQELRALLDPVRDCGRGVVALLPGGVLSNDDVFALQRHVKRPVTWTALLTVKNFPYHIKVIEEHDAAWAQGVEVWPQVSCRPLVFQMNLAEPFTLNARPSFSRIMDFSHERRVAAYRDPHWRAEAWSELSGAHGRLPVQFSRGVGGRIAEPSRTCRKAGTRASGRAELHTAGRDLGHLPR